MKRTILNLLSVLVIASPYAAHADSSLEARNALQKEAASLILQATQIYASTSSLSEKTLQAAYAEIIPNWKCPSAFSTDLQSSVPLMFSCYAMVSAEMIASAKTSPHTIKGADGITYTLTDDQLMKLQTDVQVALNTAKSTAEQTEAEYAQLGVHIAPFVKQLQQTYPDAKINQMSTILNLKRLLSFLSATANFDFKSSFADERIWNAEQDSAAFMDKYFPVTP